jgi:hypothetical protein
MPEEFACPHCEKKLKVPGHLLGRRVKCPGCGNAFLAGPEDVSAEANDDESERPSSRRPVDTEDEEREETDDNEGDENDEDEERERPRRKRRKRRRKRQSQSKLAVMLPGIAMVVLAILGLAVAIWNLVASTRHGPSEHSPGYLAGFWTSIVLPFVWALIVAAGGISLVSLRIHGLAKFAAVFAMLPCSPYCLFGIPVGIWALVQLNDPDVYNAFR